MFLITPARLAGATKQQTSAVEQVVSKIKNQIGV